MKTEKGKLPIRSYYNKFFIGFISIYRHQCPKCRKPFHESQAFPDTDMQNVIENLTFGCDSENCQVFFFQFDF